MFSHYSLPRRHLIHWLWFFPAVDVAVSVWGSGLGDNQGIKVIAEALSFILASKLFFWFGCLFAVRFIQNFIELVRSRKVALLITIIKWCGSTILVFYFLFLWVFSLSFGHHPNPHMLTFLIANFSRVPQHVLQTSPFVVILSVIVASLLAYLAERTIAQMAMPCRSQSYFLSLALFLIGAVGLMFASVEMRTMANRLTAEKWSIIKEMNTRYIASEVDRYLESLPNKYELRKPNTLVNNIPVIVILIESLRYDLLTKHPETIAFLKLLYSNNIGFERPYATASHSNLTDLAFWYSQYPLRMQEMENYPHEAPWRGTSLFAAFKNAGYTTAYISSQNEKWGHMINWLKTNEVDFFYHSEDYHGDTWENFDDLPGLAGMIKKGLVTAGKIEDSATLRIAMQWINGYVRAEGRKNFFLGMNLQNTHFSYIIPPGGSEPFQPADLGFKAIYYRWPKEKKEQVRNRYLNAVINVDGLLKKFAIFLDRLGIWDECIFVVLGDNGEAFHEHGFGNHSGPMYDEAVRTFAVIKLPRSMRHLAKIISNPVSHIDIAATILWLAGIEIPGSFQGIPIFELTLLNRPVYMYTNAIVRQYGIVDWPWKLLMTEFPEWRTELYNLFEDPYESIDRSFERPLELARLKNNLLFWISAQRRYYSEKIYLTRFPPKYDIKKASVQVGSLSR